MKINLEDSLNNPKEISVTKDGVPVNITKDTSFDELKGCEIKIRGHKLEKREDYTASGAFFFLEIGDGFGSYKENELKSKGSAFKVLKCAYSVSYVTSD